MTAWMLYSLFGAAWFAAAGWLAERVLIAGRRPLRTIWVCALVCSLIFPVVAREVERRSGAAATADLVVAATEGEGLGELAPAGETTTSPSSQRGWMPTWGSPLSRLDVPLSAVWLGLSLLMALNFVGGLGALAWMRRRWDRRTVQGRRVYVSEGTGPALVGVVTPAIVVPAWVLDLHPDHVALMLQHEEEHRRANDGRLLTAAELALVAMPWNVPLWWQVLRLRTAVELDCDARVLQSSDPRTYGDLLLEMARLGRGPRLFGSAAFAERAVHLERRIRQLARRPRGARRWASTAALGVGLAALGVAWVVPRPDVPVTLALASDDPASAAVSEPRSSLPSEATFPAAPLPSLLDAASQAAAVPATLGSAALPSACAPASTSGQAAPLVDSAFVRLFVGIPLSRGERAEACALLAGLEEEQRTLDAAARDAARSSPNATAAAAVRARRDTDLLALVDDAASRALLATRTAPGPRSAGPGNNGAGAPTAGAPAAGARAGGARQGGPNVPPNTAEATADATLRRLFDGIVLSEAQAARARSIILEAQQQMNALLPRAPTILRLTAGARTVSIRAPESAALVEGLSDESERSLLRSHIVTVPN